MREHQADHELSQKIQDNSKEEQVRQQAETNQKMRQDEPDDRYLHFELANLSNN